MKRDIVLKDIKIDGIAYQDNGESVAIIEGRSFRKGQELKGYKIEEIFSEKIILSKDGERRVLYAGYEKYSTSPGAINE